MEERGRKEWVGVEGVKTLMVTIETEMLKTKKIKSDREEKKKMHSHVRKCTFTTKQRPPASTFTPAGQTLKVADG